MELYRLDKVYRTRYKPGTEYLLDDLDRWYLEQTTLGWATVIRGPEKATHSPYVFPTIRFVRIAMFARGRRCRYTRYGVLSERWLYRVESLLRSFRTHVTPDTRRRRNFSPRPLRVLVLVYDTYVCSRPHSNHRSPVTRLSQGILILVRLQVPEKNRNITSGVRVFRL